MYSSHLSSRVKFVVLAFMPLFALILIACTGTLIYPSFSHQGKLLDSSGNPVADGSYTVKYELFHGSSGGTAVHTESGSVTVTDGFFNSDFGTTNVDPKIFSEATWLEISVNGETLSPRQYLRGAPYASGLVAGSAAVGHVPVTYTYNTYDNLGSAFFAANTDSTDTGGSGLTAITAAQLPSGPLKLDVAAVRGLAVNTDSNSSTGAYGGIFVSQDFRGLYADNGPGSAYAAWFAGDIAVSGNCVGCNIAYTAENIAENVIEPGDFVTAVGVEVDPDYGRPILLVRKATAGDAILGVADSAMSRGEFHEGGLTQLGYDEVDGDIFQDGYLSVVTQGLVQARLPQDGTLETGAFISGDGTEASTAPNIDNSVAQVMSERDENGLQWILLNR